jgi:hypothetical protein
MISTAFFFDIILKLQNRIKLFSFFFFSFQEEYSVYKLIWISFHFEIILNAIESSIKYFNFTKALLNETQYFNVDMMISKNDFSQNGMLWRILMNLMILMNYHQNIALKYMICLSFMMIFLIHIDSKRSSQKIKFMINDASCWMIFFSFITRYIYWFIYFSWSFFLIDCLR